MVLHGFQLKTKPPRPPPPQEEERVKTGPGEGGRDGVKEEEVGAEDRGEAPAGNRQTNSNSVSFITHEEEVRAWPASPWGLSLCSD